MKAIKILWLIGFFICFQMFICVTSRAEEVGINCWHDLIGKSVAYRAGGSYGPRLAKMDKRINLYEYNDNVSMFEALLAHKVDAVLFDEVISNTYVSQYANKVTYFYLPIKEEMGFALIRKSPLLKKINRILADLIANGEIDRYINKWKDTTTNKHLEKLSHKSDYSGKEGVLIYGCDPTRFPCTFMNDSEEIVGSDVEIVNRIAYELNMKLKIEPMAFGGLISAVCTGKVTMVGGSIITEERKTRVDFAKYLEPKITVLTLKPETNDSKKDSAIELDNNSSFFESFKNSFYVTLLKEERWKLILKGLGISLIITFFASILGFIFAFPICFMNLSNNKVANCIARSYIVVLQGTPILVLLMIFYYIIFRKSNIDSVVIAIISFSLNAAAYFSEMIRAGIKSVPIGQIDAAFALGFTKSMTFIKVIFPQTIKRISPVCRGEVISLLKSTSVVGYIAITDLTKMSDIIRSRTFDAFFPFINNGLDLLSCCLGYH